MTTWQEIVQQRGGELTPQGITGLADARLTTGFVTVLSDLGLISVSGDDAAQFLHNQLSNDIEHLNSEQAKLAAYCSAKGRMLASFLVWKTAGTIFLQLDKSLQASTQKRLQMFVMRAKAVLADASESSVTLGLSGAGVEEALSAWFPPLAQSPYTKFDNDNGSLIRFPSTDAGPRFQWITTPAIAQQALPALMQTLTLANTSAWRLSQIEAGIAHITALTSDTLVPQMVNFEIIGGVNFKKGCYPGQEVVARSQYLGKLKRRSCLAQIAAINLVAGAEIFSSTDPDQPCGSIVNVEQNGVDSSLALVELKLSDRDSGTVSLGMNSGIPLQFLPLPYEIIDVTQ